MTLYLGILGDRKAEVVGTMRGIEYVQVRIDEVNIDFGAAGVIDVLPLLTGTELQRIAADFEEQNLQAHMEARWWSVQDQTWS
jgi:hypothetical protein